MKLLAQISTDQRTLSICERFLSQSVINVCEIPENIRKKLITPESAMKILSENFPLIRYIPKKILKTAFFRQLWNERGNISTFNIILFLEYSPRQIFTREFSLSLIENYPTEGVLSYIPEKCITRKFCSASLRANNLLLERLPEKLLTYPFLLTLVKKKWLSLRSVPFPLRDRKISVAGIAADSNAIRYAIFK